MRKSKSTKKKINSSENSDTTKIQFTDDKIQAMKNLAAQIAKSFPETQRKTSVQIEVEAERQEKLKERQELKKLTPQALLHYNHDRANAKEDTSVNKIDDSEAKVGFSEALEYSEKTAKLHHALVSGKIKEPDKIVKKVEDIRKKVIKNHNKDPLEKYKKEYGERDISVSEKSKKREKTKVDYTGIVDGEQVDGLVRRESKKAKKDKKQTSSEIQDDFVLGKLFQKKGG